MAALSLLPSGRFTAPDRALILVSSSGIPLLLRASQASDRAVYAACLRNLSAVADHLARHHDRVAVCASAPDPRPQLPPGLAAEAGGTGPGRRPDPAA